VEVVAPGVVVAGDVELMSVDEPVLPVTPVLPAAPVVPVLPEAPMDVPLPVVEPVLPEALMSVEGVVVVDGAVLPAAVVSVDGVEGVVAGVVVLELDVEVDESVAGRSPQADRLRAATRARAAQLAMDLVCIRHSLRVCW
jgi:hypothetical protein